MQHSFIRRFTPNYCTWVQVFRLPCDVVSTYVHTQTLEWTWTLDLNQLILAMSFIGESFNSDIVYFSLTKDTESNRNKTETQESSSTPPKKRQVHMCISFQKKTSTLNSFLGPPIQRKDLPNLPMHFAWYVIVTLIWIKEARRPTRPWEVRVWKCTTDLV